MYAQSSIIASHTAELKDFSSLCEAWHVLGDTKSDKQDWGQSGCQLPVETICDFLKKCFFAETDIGIADELEEALQILLEGLDDTDTVVRWSAAKGIGRIASKLPQASILCTDELHCIEGMEIAPSNLPTLTLSAVLIVTLSRETFQQCHLVYHNIIGTSWKQRSSVVF